MFNESTSENPQTAHDQFNSSLAGGRLTADKYETSQDSRNQERVQQYRAMEQALIDNFRNARDEDERARTAKELRDVVDELQDALTRATHNRTLTRPNRFDTPEEQKIVARESAEYHRYLERTRQENRKRRQEDERASKEAEQKWNANSDFEIGYRVIASEGQGSDTTIGSYAAWFLRPENLQLLKVVQKDNIPSFIQEIDKQIHQNRNLSQGTREKLENLRNGLR